MSGLENMKKRLEFYGGSNQQERMKEDKLHGLRKSLLYSYQAATIEVPASGLYFGERGDATHTFRALMNPDKLKPEYDHKIISIPFEDIPLDLPREGKTT